MMKGILGVKKSVKSVLLCLVWLGILNLTVNWLLDCGYHLRWSQSDSMPRGLYLVTPHKKLCRYDMVEVCADALPLKFARDRGWLPEKVSVIKYIAAIPGDEVSISAEGVYINRGKYGEVLAYDRQQLPLPRLNVRRTLGSGEYLLLGKQNPHSFDGRYFGVIEEKMINGQAHLLWQV